MPYPRQDKVPSARQIITEINMALSLFPFVNLSSIVDTTASRSEIEEVSAAKSTRMKNKLPTINPIGEGKLINTLGKTTNIRPGPADNSSWDPNANTAGIITSPARIAMIESNIIIWTTLCYISISFFIYEP